MGREAPFRLVGLPARPPSSETAAPFEVRIGEVRLGGPAPVIIAGPCAVESRAQTLDVARAVKAAGGHVLRGGAFKPRTSPHDFQGLGLEGLEILAAARDETGLPVVTEVMDPRLVEAVAARADCLQIGARNMQNFPLLREAGQSGMPVLLKRHWAATLDEWLGAAEYVAAEGNLRIILCERGIRTFSQGSYNRFTLDLNVIPAVQRLSFLPVLVDPSHGTGATALVPAAGRAGIAAGACGLIVEVIAEGANPCRSLCDGYQSITPSTLAAMIRDVQAIGARRAPLPPAPGPP